MLFFKIRHQSHLCNVQTHQFLLAFIGDYMCNVLADSHTATLGMRGYADEVAQSCFYVLYDILASISVLYISRSHGVLILEFSRKFWPHSSRTVRTNLS